MKIQKLQISTKTNKYSIFIGSKLIAGINKILSSQKLSFSKILIVIDKNVPTKFKLKLINNLEFPSKARWPLDDSAPFLKGPGLKL